MNLVPVGRSLTTLDFCFEPWPEISSFFKKKSKQDTRLEYLCSGRHWAMTVSSSPMPLCLLQVSLECRENS